MRRREFMTALAGAIAAWPLGVRAQQPAMPAIGFIGIGRSEDARNPLVQLQRGLAENGFVEGQNFTFESRFAEFHPERLASLAADLVNRQVTVIVVFTSASLEAARAATNSIPIVFFNATDVVASGLVASYSQPGGNLTGVAVMNVELTAKRLEILHELLPTTTSVALLSNPTNPIIAEAETRELQVASRIFGTHLLVVNASDASEFESAFATLVRERVGALVVSADIVFANLSDQILTLAARHSIPAIYQDRKYTAAGGLVSYGAIYPDAFRMVGVYAAHILKGEKAADLPVYQVTKFELAINLKSANALGITVPQTLLARADEVIE
jgi:putative tryptophan/tyrosine transport system substrate-binding protein